MKTCTICNALMDDNALFCTSCGSKFGEAAPVEAEPQQAPAQEAYIPPVQPAPGAPVYTQVPPAQPVYQPPVADPSDHTAEFSAEEVAEYKLYATFVYISGLLGIILALIANKESAYLKFHIKQKMKMMLTMMAIMVVASVTAILVLPLLVASVLSLIISIANIICIVKTVQGKSIEPMLVKDIKILK